MIYHTYNSQDKNGEMFHKDMIERKAKILNYVKIVKQMASNIDRDLITKK
jgi:hypothetical protein